MKNSLNKEITFLSLIKYALPTILMMILFSLYTIVDGMFVSRFVGSNALSAVNIVFPIINILLAVGIMFATGGNAIVAKLMGEEKYAEANKSFSLIILTGLSLGIIIALLSLIFINPLIELLGSTESLKDYCKTYLTMYLLFTPFVMLKSMFDYFFVTAGKPNLGLICSIAGGVTNIFLDYIFIVILDMGIKGAALGTGIGLIFPSIIGLIYFFNKKNILHFSKPKFNLQLLIDSCSNGSSEMVTNIATAITTFAYNIAMIKYLGEDGVAAITIILYIEFILFATYMGFTSGVSPRISYNYGAKNSKRIRKIVKYSYIHIILLSILSFIIITLLGDTLLALFAGRGTNVYSITSFGLKLFSISFLISGTNIFTSGMFTAFSNGKVSALLSFFRTFVFFIIGIIILPYFIGANGIWFVAPFYEFASLILSLLFVIKYRKIYGYF